MRIAIAQISSESNHFVTTECELDFFRNTGFLLEGERLFNLRGTGGEVDGMLSVLDREEDISIAPLIAARANSGSPLSAACYWYLRSALLERLERAMPVDGILLSHHGSMAAAGEFDPEGDIAAEVRRRVGGAAPIVMTLDLHANVTRRMVEHCTAILGYEEYPHRDTFRTGRRAAGLLVRTSRGEVSPCMACAKLPLLLTAFHGTTDGDPPFARLMRRAKEVEHQQRILSASMFFVGSYIDVPEMGSCALVVTDGDAQRGMAVASELAGEFWRARGLFAVETVSVSEAVRRGMEIKGGPILLLDTADTTGGGAAGDGAGLIQGLLDADLPDPCLAMVVDPAAALACAEAGTGAEIELQLGHRVDSQWGSPVPVRAKVLRIFDGRFSYSGGILGGTQATMGPSAVVQAGSLSILIATYPTYDWADEQYRCAGLDPRSAKFVGVKNMMNFRYGYGEFAKGHFVLDLAGPTPPDMRMLPFRRVPRPIFPLDSFAGEPVPQVYSNARVSRSSCP
jgi:microcystin degradation protein MlrC